MNNSKALAKRFHRQCINDYRIILSCLFSGGSSSLASIGQWINKRPAPASSASSVRTPAPAPNLSAPPSRPDGNPTMQQKKKPKAATGSLKQTPQTGSLKQTPQTTDFKPLVPNEKKQRKGKGKKKETEQEALSRIFNTNAGMESSTDNANHDVDVKAEKRETKKLNGETVSTRSPETSEVRDTRPEPPHDWWDETEAAEKAATPAATNRKSAKKSHPMVTESDYPPLGSMKAPPGISKPPGLMGAPPGLNKSSPSVISKPPPPGLMPSASLDSAFNMASLASFITPDPSAVKFADYLDPINCTARNRQLIFKLKDLVNNDMDKFHKFKNMSTDFRASKMGAREFYDSCDRLLGPDVFREFLPELLVLLPDINLQHNLYSIMVTENTQPRRNGGWAVKPADSLQVCVTCQQIVTCHDSAHHQAQHGLAEGDFPTLGKSNSSGHVLRAFVKKS